MKNTDGIDLSSIQDVKTWLGIGQGNTSDDSPIQDCITAFSVYVLRLTARGAADGSIPTVSPFVQPVSYDEFYDGSGTDSLQLRNWPITAVASLNVNGRTIPASSGIGHFGYVVDGDGKFLSMRSGGWNYQRGGGCSSGFPDGAQNVEVQYTAGFAAVPFDLEMAVRKTVALNYKRKSWIGQRAQAMAGGAGTVSYSTWEMDADAARTIEYYAARG